MSRSVELPDPVYDALEETASASGMTPAAWIAAQVLPKAPVQPNGTGEPPKSLAERFAGRVGRIASGGAERLSESSADDFAEHLEAQRRAGRL
jgi:hypothetical protein